MANPSNNGFLIASQHSFPFTSTNFSALDVTNAYKYFVQLCDDPARRDLTLTSSALTLFIIYTLGIVSQLIVLPANCRLAKHRSAFLLLLYINVFDLVWLLEYIWLSLEFLIGARLHSKYHVGAYLFRFVNFCIDTFYIELAFNRCTAFLFPRIYSAICSGRNMKICVLCTCCLSVAYSIYMNWFPERRPFHCLIQLGYFEPMTSIPKAIAATLPDATLYDGVQIAELVSICIPFVLYAITVLKMVHDYRHHHPAQGSTVQIAFVIPHGSLTTHEDRAKFVNLMQERTRLFSMCLVSQVPYYMSHALYQSSRIFQLDAHTVQILAILWQLLGTIFHVQQPILMLLLSKDLRSSVRNDLTNFWDWLKGRFC